MEVTHEQLAMLIEEHRRAGLPLFVDGATGIGKSEAGVKSSKMYADRISRQWVAWVDLSNIDRHRFLDDKEIAKVHLFVDIRTALLEPTDLLGLPFKDDRGYVAWLPTLLFKILSLPSVSATIFFDEFNLGSLMVMKSCLPAGYLISGFGKPIEALEIGDKIISERGAIDEVIMPMGRSYEGNINTIKAIGMMPVEFTDEHPILITTIKKWKSVKNLKNPKGWGRVAEFNPLIWKKASEIHGGDYLFIPKIKGYIKKTILDFKSYKKSGYIGDMSIPLNEETAFLLGAYVAEGCCCGENHISLGFGLSKNENLFRDKCKNIIEKYFGYRATIHHSKVSASQQVTFGGNVIGRAFKEWFGKLSGDRKIPDFILFNENDAILKAFLHGYWVGDGCVNKDNGIIMTTASKVLAEQLQLAFTKFGIYFNISWYNPKISVIRGRIINSLGAYTVKTRNKKAYLFFRLIPPKKRVIEWHKDFGDKIAIKISSINKRFWKGQVYNCETKSHTYSVNNIIVHNCYQLILDKAIGEIKLGKDVTILAAGNRIEDRAHVTESPAPLNNRFSHCTLLCPTPDEWIMYNLKSEYPEPRLVSFIKFKPKYIFDFKPNQKEKAFPTPRALQQLAMLLKGKDEMSELDNMTMLAQAKCGDAFGAEFQSFLRLTRKVNVDEILEHPEKVHEFEKQLDLKYSLISGVAVRIKQDFSKMEKALKVIAELEDEYGVFLLRMIIDICGMKVLSFLEHSPTWETKLYDKFKDILSTRFAQVN
jgi:hypothetical protein